jgi:DUF971 family protein
MENLGVKSIKQMNDRTLGITWSDNKETLFDVVELRRLCPCALCIDEWTREKKLKDGDVKDDVRPVKIDSVGRYAIGIKFNDGHSTGIYTYQMLRNKR